MRLIRVRTQRFEAGFLSDGGNGFDGSVIATHPALAFMLGWPDAKARGAIKRNSWTATIADDPALKAQCTVRAPGRPGAGADRRPALPLRQDRPVRHRGVDPQGAGRDLAVPGALAGAQSDARRCLNHFILEASTWSHWAAST
jgi:hypothetical protein